MLVRRLAHRAELSGASALPTYAPLIIPRSGRLSSPILGWEYTSLGGAALTTPTVFVFHSSTVAAELIPPDMTGPR